MTNAAKILNLIRLRGSNEYQNQVPALDDMDAIGKISGPILTQPLIYKEFTELFGAFIEMQVLKRTWNNPLADLIKTRQQPLGEYSAEVTANPINPKQYDPMHPEKLLEYSLDEDFVQYYARNVKEMFKITIAYEDLQGAFSTFSSFEDYVSMKITQLESGRQISSYNHIMEAIVANYNAGLFVTKLANTTTSSAVSESDIANWVADVKTSIDNFQFPSYDYNNYGKLAGSYGNFRGWTNFDDIYIIARTDFVNDYLVKYLRNAYNLSPAEIGKKIIKIPAFAYDNYDKDGHYINTVESNIQMMICDRRMFQFSTDMQIDDSFYNPETLTRNYYKHWWATYGVSALANCICYVDEKNSFSFSQNRVNVWKNEPIDIVAINNESSQQTIYRVLGVTSSASKMVEFYKYGADYSDYDGGVVFSGTHSVFETAHPSSDDNVVELTDSNDIIELLYLILANNSIFTIDDTSDNLTSFDLENSQISMSIKLAASGNEDSTSEIKISRATNADYTNYDNITEFLSEDNTYFKAGTTVKYYFNETNFKKAISENNGNVIYKFRIRYYNGSNIVDTNKLYTSDSFLSLKEI